MSAEVDQIEQATPPGRWYAGMPSPNPGGRPKQVAHLQELAREHTAAALAKILSLMEDPKTSRITQLACARELLDRAYGTPPQSITVTPDTDPMHGSVHLFDVARRLAFLLTAGNHALSALPSAPVVNSAEDA